MNYTGLYQHNLTMLTEFCQFNVASGAFNGQLSRQTAYYDLFFRSVPDGGGFIIAAGLSGVNVLIV